MYKILLFILFNFSIGIISGQTFTTDFDGTDDLNISTSGGDILNGSTGIASPAGGVYGNPTNGFVASNETATITTTAITTAGISTFTMNLAALSGTTGNGLEAGDEVTVEVSINNGSSFSTPITVNGNSNARWTYAGGGGTASTSFSMPITQAPSGGGIRDDNNDGIADIIISAIPSGVIVIRVTLDNNNAAEFWAVDNLVLDVAAAQPAINLSPISGNTSESGTTATFDVTLNTAPATDVVLNVTSGNIAENSVSPSTLTFTTGDYNVAQTVTVTGVDDLIIDGNQTTTITVATNNATSDDEYDDLSQTVDVINEDDECAITTVAATASCNGNNTDFIVTWTEVNTSGTVEVDINGVGYQTITNGGTYTITGPTTAATGVTLTVRDANDNSCMATTTVDIPLCPIPVPNIFISEVSDASSFSNDFLELHNNSNFSVDLTDYKLERLNAGTTASEYIFDIGSDETGSGSGSDFVIPANGFLVIARGASSRTDFETAFPSFPAAAAFNRGNTNLFFGNGRRWRLRLDDGTANTANGTILDDTNQGVANVSRDYRNDPQDNWTNSTAGSATPGEFDLGGLPIELLRFTAKAHNQTVIVKWSTATELNNDYMLIERSTDSRELQEIGMVQGAGTTNELQEYTFIDKNPEAGINYYRLLQVDFDGTATSSNIVSIDFTPKNGDLSIYPNPTTDILTIKYPVKWKDKTVITIMNSLGQIVKVINEPAETFSVSDLPVGMYNLQVTNGLQSISKFFAKE
ncbi:MAG: T9SS type A sorting domain-containing protein [Saprospiraceae bacterium]